MPVGGCVAGSARVEIKQGHRIARTRPEEIDFTRREVRAEIHVGPVRVIVILEIVDDRAVIQFAQKDGRPEAAVAHNQIRSEVSRGLADFVGSVGMPNGVLKRPCAVVVGLRSPPFDVEPDAADLVLYP